MAAPAPVTGKTVGAGGSLRKLAVPGPGWAAGGGGMKITVQITVRSDEGQVEAVREVARLERGPLQPETLGLSLAEARSILAGLERTMAEGQAAEFVALARRCARCGRQRTCRGHHQIVFRTLSVN
jgi:hypothetical protein